MSVTLFAQPYNIEADGFYFSSPADYQTKADDLQDRFGQPVEEFEIQFIDGADLDCALATAWGLHQGNLEPFFAALESWDDDQKTALIIAVGECGYGFDPATTHPDDFEIDLYYLDSLRELAQQFLAEGLFGDIPAPLQNYIDLDAIARDLSCDYAETQIAGTRLVYRCA